MIVGEKRKHFVTEDVMEARGENIFLKLFVYVFFRVYIFDTDDMCTYCFKCKSKKDI